MGNVIGCIGCGWEVSYSSHMEPSDRCLQCGRDDMMFAAAAKDKHAEVRKTFKVVRGTDGNLDDENR